jgi:hypothetical protein
MLIKTIGTVDITRLLLEVQHLIDANSKQLMLQGVAGESSDYGTGYIAGLKHAESDFIHELHHTPYLNTIMQSYGMTRTRLLRLIPTECYSYHVDPTPRVHIPLITDENCMAVLEDTIYRLPADGSVYFVDTTRRHTFLNAGDYDRFHIVGIAPAR